MKKKEIKIVLNKLKKTLGLKTLIILIVLLSFNTYAWFVFSSKVDTEMGAKVRAWNITFMQDDQNVSQSLTFDVDEITSVRILDTTYTVGQNNYTSDGIIEMLSEDFPFHVDLVVSNSTILMGRSETFSIDVNWDFEENDDAVDTLWGQNAYTFNHANPNTPSISINLTIHINQMNSS